MLMGRRIDPPRWCAGYEARSCPRRSGPLPFKVASRLSDPRTDTDQAAFKGRCIPVAPPRHHDGGPLPRPHGERAISFLGGLMADPVETQAAFAEFFTEVLLLGF